MSLVNIYKNGVSCQEFNRKAESNRWIKAIKEFDLKRIRVAMDSVKQFHWLDTPFFIIPQSFFGKVLGFSLRSLNGESHVNQSEIEGFYSYTSEKALDSKGEFTYNDPLIVTEGPLDAEVVADIYPYTVASMTSIPTILMTKMVSTITRKLIFVPDNDEAGEKAENIFRYRMKDLDYAPEYEIIHVPKQLKDAGEFIEQTNYKDTLDYKVFKSRILNGVR